MLLPPSSTTRRRLRAGAACMSACLVAASVSLPARAQEPAGSGITPPRAGSVRTDKNPLSRRSAEENIVFGRIVNTDEHRLSLREGEGDAEPTVYRLSPKVRVYSGDREVRLSDVPSNTRIHFQRAPKATDEITEIYVDAEEGASRDSAPSETAVPPTRVVGSDSDTPAVSKEVVPPVELGATLETTPDGVAIVRMADASPLRDAGMRAGDYIKSAAGQSVVTPEGLFRVLNKFDGGVQVELTAMRGEESMDFTMTLPEDHEKVLVDATAANATGLPHETERIRGPRSSNTELLQQILQNQYRQQQQLNYLAHAMQRLAQAAGVNDDGAGFGIVGGFPFGGTGTGGAGEGNCYCAIGFNPQGNPVIGFTQNGKAVAVVSYNAAGVPILVESAISERGAPDTANDRLSSNDQNGDGLPDGPDRDGDGFPPAANENAGAKSNCVCPIGVDSSGNPIVGVTQQGLPVAVVGANAEGQPILAETRFGSNGQTAGSTDNQPEPGEVTRQPVPQPEPIVPLQRGTGQPRQVPGSNPGTKQ